MDNQFVLKTPIFNLPKDLHSQLVDDIANENFCGNFSYFDPKSLNDRPWIVKWLSKLFFGNVTFQTYQLSKISEELVYEYYKDFIDFVSKELKLEELPIIKLRKDPQWSVVHKTFGRYIDDRNMLEVAWGQRHIMDVLRTVAHELTHRRQHEREDVPSSAGETGSPYENEANARAGILMRDYARLHPEYFEAGQAEQLHGDEVKENYADFFKTSAPVSAVKPTRGTMNIEGFRVDYDAKNKSIIISRNGQVVHQEGGTSTGQGRPLTTDAIASRARRIINQLEGDEVDEGVKEKLGALAAAACIAGTPGCATTQDALRTTQDIGRTVKMAKGLSRAGVQAELDQELRNYLRAKSGQSGEGNLSNI